MSKFSDSELGKCQWIGSVALMIGVFVAIIAHACLARDVGTPEYLICLRGSGWTAALLSCVWLGIATLKRMNLM